MLADLALLYCALFWGLSFPVMKVLVTIYPSCWLLFLRFTAGAVMLYAFFFRRINASLKQNLKGGIIIGVLLFLAITVQTIGLIYIGGGRSAFITAVYVPLVPLIIWALTRKFPGYITLLAAVLCVTGMYFLAGDDLSGSVNAGDILTLMCAVFFAFQIIAISKYTQGHDPITLSFIEFVTIAALSFLSSIIFEPHNEIINTESIYGLLFMIVFCTFGCYTVQVYAQKYAEPSHATIIMSLESVFGLLSSIIFTGEEVTSRMALGCTLIFMSVITAEIKPFIESRLK